MRKYGLIGKTLQHSYSQRWFEEHLTLAGITDATYSLWELASVSELRQWVALTGCEGFNVTLPYKQAVVPYLDRLDADADAIGAVNCVTIESSPSGKQLLVGHNTDWQAFLETLRPLLDASPQQALILGTGGAAQAVGYALRQLNIAFRFVSRHPEQHPGSIGYGEAYSQAQRHQLIVNATPIGMFPNDSETPWQDLHNIGMGHLCYDLIYNPEESRWLLECQLAGATTLGGLAMLKRQAELSWQLFGLGPLPPLSSPAVAD